jgi:putative flippase GtrA
MAATTRATAPRPALLDRHPLARQLARYLLAGGVGTGVNALVYLALRTGWDDALQANLVALLVSTLVSTEVNRRFTFDGAHGHPWREHLQTVGVVAFYAVYSSGVLLALAALVDDPSPLLESAAVAGASVLGGAGRYLLLRYWVFPDDEHEDHSHRHPVSRFLRVHRRWIGRVAVAAALGAALVLAAACVPFV